MAPFGPRHQKRASAYIFYNRVDPAQVGLYGHPPNATNDALWARAVRENPDPGW
ncbi:hypothetical protein B0H14DRAFT_3761051 [Mycena olivaceomarginata]|nr:hypothetical protein B0H14DRAFT_3761051 [Mycena olivaceomarginata]